MQEIDTAIPGWPLPGVEAIPEPLPLVAETPAPGYRPAHAKKKKA